MPQSKKYLKFGLRSDKNLSDLTDTDVAITNIINDMSVQSQPGATIVESFDASSRCYDHSVKSIGQRHNIFR